MHLSSRSCSYLHCSWETAEDIEAIDTLGRHKLSKYLSSSSSKKQEGEEVEYFNPEYVIVQRIIGSSSSNSILRNCKSAEETKELISSIASNGGPLDAEKSALYLIKGRGLTYADCSWERLDEISDASDEIFKFWQRESRRTEQREVNTSLPPDLHKVIRSRCLSDSRVSQASQLRDYQVEGVEWLLKSRVQRQPCVLNDESGLGKSVQALAYIRMLHELRLSRPHEPVLVLMSSYLLNHWQNQADRWISDLNTIVYHGREKDREIARLTEFYYKDSRDDKLCKFDVILTTFETASRELDLLRSLNLSAIIFDEAHKFRNSSSKPFLQLMRLRANHVIMLSNNSTGMYKPENLWPLLHLGDHDKFVKLEEDKEFIDSLKSEVGPGGAIKSRLILRRSRLQPEVRASLPVVNTFNLPVPLTELQRKVSTALFELFSSRLTGAVAFTDPERHSLVNELIYCAAHPSLVQMPTKYASDPDLMMFESSSKIRILNALLPALVEQKKKVVLCSQFISMLDVMESYLRQRGTIFERIDSSMKLPDKAIVSERFNHKSFDRSLLLLSFEPGSTQGVDLSVADTVILYDGDPRSDVTWLSTHYKVGMQHSVVVFRLLCLDSVELAIIKELRGEVDAQQSRLTEDDEIGPPRAIATNVFRGKPAQLDSVLRTSAYLTFSTARYPTYDSNALNQYIQQMLTAGSTPTLETILRPLDEFDDKDPGNSFWHGPSNSFVQESMGPNLRNTRKKRLRDTESDGDASGMRSITSAVDVIESKDYETVFQDQGSKPNKGDRSNEEFGKSKGGGQRINGDGMRIKNELFEWGTRSRDKATSCLITFGFGRWHRIIAESGLRGLSLSEIENFGKAYILQCGLAAAEVADPKGETDFVKVNII